MDLYTTDILWVKCILLYLSGFHFSTFLYIYNSFYTHRRNYSLFCLMSLSFNGLSPCNTTVFSVGLFCVVRIYTYLVSTFCTSDWLNFYLLIPDINLWNYGRVVNCTDLYFSRSPILSCIGWLSSIIHKYPADWVVVCSV